jgi:hypothetical protein
MGLGSDVIDVITGGLVGHGSLPSKKKRGKAVVQRLGGKKHLNELFNGKKNGINIEKLRELTNTKKGVLENDIVIYNQNIEITYPVKKTNMIGKVTADYKVTIQTKRNGEITVYISELIKADKKEIIPYYKKLLKK